MNLPFDSALRMRIVEHLVGAVDSIALVTEPFPHVLLPGFFPNDVYERLLNSFPPQVLYEPFQYEKHHQGDGESNRLRFQMNNVSLDRIQGEARELWYAVRSALGSEELRQALFGKLAPGLAFRYGLSRDKAQRLPAYALPELFHEKQGYSIKPHPDTRKKVVTMQIALAKDDSQEPLGTEFYRRAADPRVWLRPPRGFEIVRRMPFLPNTAYAFVVLNTLRLKSWHGRTAIPGSFGERNSLLNIWYEKIEHANADLMAEKKALESAAVVSRTAA